MKSLKRPLMLRSSDPKGLPQDVELFSSGGRAGSSRKVQVALQPQTPLYLPVFFATDKPGDRVFDRAARRLLYGQAPIYRNAAGRVSLQCARDWGCQGVNIFLRISGNGWLMADIHEASDANEGHSGAGGATRAERGIKVALLRGYMD
jgi:hypothetical protein